LIFRREPSQRFLTATRDENREEYDGDDLSARHPAVRGKRDAIASPRW
jgi:hypothetical protein